MLLERKDIIRLYDSIDNHVEEFKQEGEDKRDTSMGDNYSLRETRDTIDTRRFE